eukprot:6038282-Prymnesium_polylepis.1
MNHLEPREIAKPLPPPAQPAQWAGGTVAVRGGGGQEKRGRVSPTAAAAAPATKVQVVASSHMTPTSPRQTTERHAGGDGRGGGTVHVQQCPVHYWSRQWRAVHSALLV